MNRFRLAPAADTDIDDLAEHIAKTQSLAAADRFIDAIYEKCELLALHSDIERLRPELTLSTLDANRGSARTNAVELCSRALGKCGTTP